MDTFLFNETISNWDDWGRVYQSIPAFRELAKEILRREKLPNELLQNLTPGTNAVFKCGGYVLKIFAPEESGIDQTTDMNTEIFGISRANKLGVAAPLMAAHGFIEDKYRFAYIATEYAEGCLFKDAAARMTSEEKFSFARKLRRIIDKLNAPCQPFNDIDAVLGPGRFKRWDKFSESFRASRLEYIRRYDYGERVFVHGDLCEDNILISEGGEPVIIDFADSVLAPVCYEHALMPFTFNWDASFMRGYFGDASANELTEEIFSGILIHDFGGDLVKDYAARPEDFNNIDELRRILESKVKGCMSGPTPRSSFGAIPLSPNQTREWK